MAFSPPIHARRACSECPRAAAELRPALGGGRCASRNCSESRRSSQAPVASPILRLRMQGGIGRRPSPLRRTWTNNPPDAGDCGDRTGPLEGSPSHSAQSRSLRCRAPRLRSGGMPSADIGSERSGGMLPYAPRMRRVRSVRLQRLAGRFHRRSALALQARLEQLRHTPESRRLEGQAWPSENAFAEAVSFINRLPLARIPTPSIHLAHDGEVSFPWIHQGVTVDLGFYGTGTWSYFARGKRGEKLYRDNLEVSAGLPSEVMNQFET